MPTALARLASAAALLALSSTLPLLAQESRTTKPEAVAAPKTEAPNEQAPSEQDPASGPVANPSLEAGEVGAAPPGWRFSSATGGVVAVVDEGAAAGARAARIDASAAKGRGMSNLMQSIDAGPWQGKRVRYRAAVRVAELGDGVGAQLWCRVDRPEDDDGNAQLGAFDNMQSRPITAAAWERYDIVLDVADDATRIALGVFVLGKGKVWLDDVSLEEVDLTVATTGAARPASSRSRGYQMPAAVRAAMATAQDAPRQPFWTWWLTLPALAAGLFVLGMWPRPQSAGPSAGDEALLAAPGAPTIGPLRAFALRFTVCYWLLYCLPGPFPSALSSIGRLLDRGAAVEWMSFLEGWSQPLFWVSSKLSVWSRAAESWLAHRTGEWFFGLQGELVPPNGSGDTTMGYLIVLDWFALAVALAAVWTLLLRRRAVRRDAAVDLTRSYLRYVLAFAMLGYGLAKVNMARNQFPEVSELRLDKTWGETSPMGLVWGFMGASRPYTIFAGLGEVVAAFFLLWRHTALLGAIVAVAVMTNVVMLNYCYDVPVKIYSTHLTLMGLLILVPDARRLLALLMGNRNPTDAGTPNVWVSAGLGWLRWLPKTVVVAVCFLLPMAERAWELATYEASAPPAAKDGADAGRHLLTDRGYRWINEVPFNR